MRIIALLATIAALVVVPAAVADGVYHSQHVGWMPVAAGESGTGFVENIHANGPNVFAHEQYVLRAGLSRTTYDVGIHVSSPADLTCAAPFLEATTATFTTNPAGNGTAYHVFTPEDVAGLHGLTVHVYWTLSTGGAVAYTTSCQSIQLD